MKLNLKHKAYFLLPVVLFVFISCTSSQPAVESKLSVQTIAPAADISLELPAYNHQDQIIKHTASTLKYVEEYEQAAWVAYRLIPSDFITGLKRSEDFREDPEVLTGSASPEDYKKSGYDRGHLAPAADMKYSDITMSESFYMSNMSPQKPGFNRGIWKQLEEQVRIWAEQNEELYVVTAGILKGNLSTIGKTNRVGVPQFFYKVLLDYKGPELKAIAFIIPNEKSVKSLESFAVTVDQVEKETDIDFFPALPDDIEEKLESSINLSKWEFRKSK